MTQLETIHLSADYLRKQLHGQCPEVGIVLGSGLGRLADHIRDAKVFPYKDIPGFSASTAIGHKGNLIVGSLGGKTVAALQGRFHFYEGHGMHKVVFPIRVLKLLGMRWLFVSNAAGGTHPDFKVGDIMIIRDHINLLPNPLIGPNLEEFGPRFPDMTRPYDPDLIRRAEAIAEQEGIPLQKGVYLSCTGPCYETPAEYGYFRHIGADAVGMSTTSEVIVARHSGIPVFGVSVITDVAPTGDEEDYVTDGEAIVQAADACAEKMTRLFTRMIAGL